MQWSKSEQKYATISDVKTWKARFLSSTLFLLRLVSAVSGVGTVRIPQVEGQMNKCSVVKKDSRSRFKLLFSHRIHRIPLD